MGLIGPNCLGIMKPAMGLNATFAKSTPKAGNVAFLSQSGALLTAIPDWSQREEVGFSAIVSTGSMLDVGWGDLIDYFGDDPHTHSILVYMETAKAIAGIAANYAKPLRVDELAQMASMGISTLHHHFRMMTSMSPLQYQKQLRLQSARSLMLNNGLDAASAAFAVGYESATQFNREYSRFFGQPPMRDVRALLPPGAPKLELVGGL